MASQPDASPAHTDAPTQTGLIAAGDLKPGDRLAGRFRIEGLLGIGGMGVVYRARDLSLDIDVAVKLLRPELARKPEAFERFRQELLLARQVSSPYVVRIHDIAQDGARWFISMDFVEGESLERRLDTRGKFGLEDAVAIVRGLLDGLGAAHARGVVHRDLKPANVLIDAAGRPCLTDFGVARSLGATGATQSGVIVGTPEYLSPEQARGEAVDGRSDLYAVGLILYEMLAGTLPFAGGTPAETVMQRLVRPPPSLAKTRPDLPAWVHAFCQRLLMLNPAHRFASAADALRALEARRVPRPPLDRRVWLVGLLALCVLVGAADWWRRRAATPAAAAAPALARVPHVAVLPFEATGDDEALAALARLLEEDLHLWLQAHPDLAVAPRRRVLDALARVAPGLHGDALARQREDVARAANADRLWSGQLRRDGGGLHLSLRHGAASAPAVVELNAADAGGLVRAFRQAVSTSLQSATSVDFANWGPADPTELGRALTAMDRHDYDTAAHRLAGTGAAAPLGWLLQAQEALHQELPAQATRREALARFGDDPSPSARRLVAHAQASSGDGAAAQRSLAAAVQRYPHDAELALEQAQVLADNGEGAAAQAVLQARVADDAQDAEAWFALGRNAIQQGQAQPAVDDYLVRALVLSTRAGDRRAQGDVHNALGVGYERLGQLDAALDQYTQAVALRDAAGDKAALATSLRNLAVVQAVRGDRAAAEKTLDRAGALAQALGDRKSLADLYNDRGVIAEERGDFAAALDAYREALALRQQLDLPDLVAQSLNNIGFCQYQLGAFDDALVYWQQAEAAYAKLEDRSGALQATQSIGLLEIARGHFDLARQRLQESLRTAQDHQLPEEAAVAHVYLGELALAEGRFGDALGEADSARAAFARRQDERGLAEAALLHARTALALGDAAAAGAALAPLAVDKLNPEQRALAALTHARLSLLEGDTAAATRELDRAAQAAELAHSGVLALETGVARLHVQLAAGDVAGARKGLPALRESVRRTHHVPLRLAVLEGEAAVALRSGDRAAAARAYRESLELLRRAGAWRDAALLHALGSAALPPGAEAQAAHDAALAARRQLLDATPAAARAGLERELARREREDIGHELP